MLIIVVVSNTYKRNGTFLKKLFMVKIVDFKSELTPIGVVEINQELIIDYVLKIDIKAVRTVEVEWIEVEIPLDESPD